MNQRRQCSSVVTFRIGMHRKGNNIFGASCNVGNKPKVSCPGSTLLLLDAPFEHLGLQIAFGVLRPKPLVGHLGLRVAFGALRPKPLVGHLGLRVAFGALRPKSPIVKVAHASRH
jgi:hypothetical protein